MKNSYDRIIKNSYGVVKMDFKQVRVSGDLLKHFMAKGERETRSLQKQVEYELKKIMQSDNSK